ncbi:hypothetical protein [Halocynthiibacter namhaensis]|uniref:hypothetical protein n=1 Tax=Halocynthiibacter namhaensis TaxID=1290553 RepID=UPI0012E091E4|nr:hypothetical protein [Halocynthiibacter namhaensis]
MESERPNYQEYRADFARYQVEAAGQEKSEQISAKLSADIENATTHEGKMRAVYAMMENSRPNDHEYLADLARDKDRFIELARLSDEKGFAPKVNQASTALYHGAQAGTLKPFSFGSRDDAVEYASRTISVMQGSISIINHFGGGDPKIDGTFEGRTLREGQEMTLKMQQMNAMDEDRLNAARMRLVVEADVLAKSLGVDGPIYGQKDGQMQLSSFDISFEGEPLMRSFSGGTYTEYRQDAH